MKQNTVNKLDGLKPTDYNLQRWPFEYAIKESLLFPEKSV